jgi:uncharacterized protein (DUF2249 family)
MANPHLYLHADQIYPFDARGIAKRFRRAALLGALDALWPGETLRFCNDHDPLPLIEYLRRRYGDRLDIHYVKRASGEIIVDLAKKLT